MKSKFWLQKFSNWQKKSSEIIKKFNKIPKSDGKILFMINNWALTRCSCTHISEVVTIIAISSLRRSPLFFFPFQARCRVVKHRNNTPNSTQCSPSHFYQDEYIVATQETREYELREWENWALFPLTPMHYSLWDGFKFHSFGRFKGSRMKFTTTESIDCEFMAEKSEINFNKSVKFQHHCQTIPQKMFAHLMLRLLK